MKTPGSIDVTEVRQTVSGDGKLLGVLVWALPRQERPSVVYVPLKEIDALIVKLDEMRRKR